MNLDARLFADFCTFARAQIASGDLDPTYLVLRKHYERVGLIEEARLWRTLLYVTWYSLSSAERLWSVMPLPTTVRARDVAGFLTGIERRGFRGNSKAAEHINAVLKASGGELRRWVWTTVGPGGKQGWARVRKAFMELPHGGPWSSYKWADLLAHVHGYPITADDLGVGGGSETAGPIPGMVRLTGESWQVCASDPILQMRLLSASMDKGVPFSGLDQLETALCDFNSLCKGRYYVGHDIDQQMDSLPGCSTWLREAREASFASRYLGECGGWTGVRRELKSVYAREGRVLT